MNSTSLKSLAHDPKSHDYTDYFALKTFSSIFVTICLCFFSAISLQATFS